VEGDRELARACVAGEAGAFETLVERSSRSVYQLCFRFVGNHEDASDLSQDVFLRAHRGLVRFNGRSALSTWLYRIGVNVCLNHVSAKRPFTEPLEPERHIDTSSADPASLVARGARAAPVRAAIARLPEKQRATLILRTYHELPHREIAAIMGNSVGAVKANCFHALGNLKKLLADEPL
jgi:RNA polymerase sigma-70 factor (ECF subfamily)